MPYTTIQCCTVRCSTVQYVTIRCQTEILYSAVQCTVQCTAQYYSSVGGGSGASPDNAIIRCRVAAGPVSYGTHYCRAGLDRYKHILACSTWPLSPRFGGGDGATSPHAPKIWDIFIFRTNHSLTSAAPCSLESPALGNRRPASEFIIGKFTTI